MINLRPLTLKFLDSNGQRRVVTRFNKDERELAVKFAETFSATGTCNFNAILIDAATGTEDTFTNGHLNS